METTILGLMCGKALAGSGVVVHLVSFWLARFPIDSALAWLEIQIHALERRGRRAKGWRSSSRIVEPGWLWTAWSRSKNAPGPQEGRLRDPSLQALLREHASFNTGLCVITTRTPIADIATLG